MHLTLKTALADISAATNTRKQSAVIFKVFVLWLRNQRYYPHDVIGIKMAHRDLPYCKSIRLKHAVYKLNKKQAQNHANCLYTFRKWSITWSQIIVSGSFKRWLIFHSMTSTVIYSSCDSGELNMADRA